MEKGSPNDTFKEVEHSLKTKGISFFDCPFSDETLSKWNKLLDPEFAKMGNGYRTEVSIAKLYELGIFNEFFNPTMRSFIRSLMPDANLLTFHCYENAGNQSFTIKTRDNNVEWHRDVSDLVGLNNDDLNYLSIFFYLTNVGEKSGAFEIRPLSPNVPLQNSDDSLRVVGTVGKSFVWNRTFFHRQSINESPQRRRVLKLSIQHNYLENDSILTKDFKEVFNKIDPQETFLRYMTGEQYELSHRGKLLPNVDYLPLKSSEDITTNSKVIISSLTHLFRKIRAKIRKMI